MAAYRGRVPTTIEDDVAHDRGLLRILFDVGWTRLGWPEWAGGLGGSEIHRACVYDELAAHDVALPEAFVLLETLGPVLCRYAPALARTHLPRYLAGEELWGQGFSEPDAGSDLASVRTTAVALPSGGWRVNGQKIWTTLGHCAAMALLLCRTGPPEAGRRGLSMLWVDLAAPGVEVRPIMAANGRNEFAEMFFADVEVTDDAVIGETGDGWAVAMYLLQFERGMYAWLRQAKLHQQLRYALASSTGDDEADPAMRTVGTAVAKLGALRARSAATVARLAAGEVLGPEASVDKVLLSQSEQLVMNALRALDPVAFLAGDDAAAVAGRADWSYSRAASIFGGVVEVQRGIIAEHLLGLPRVARRG
jgi:hypothetical protein